MIGLHAKDIRQRPRPQPKSEPIARTSAHQERDLNLSLQYAQTRGFWSTISDVRRAKGNLPQLNELFNNRYGKPEEGFAVIGGGAVLAETGSFDFGMGLDAEGIGLGIVRNPVVPELNATVLVSTHATPFLHSSKLLPFDFEIGPIVGWSYQKRIKAVSTA